MRRGEGKGRRRMRVRLSVGFGSGGGGLTLALAVESDDAKTLDPAARVTNRKSRETKKRKEDRNARFGLLH